MVNWHNTWMDIAKSVSFHSHDEKYKVGAIVVSSDNSQLLSLGYNGNYSGGPHESESQLPGQSGFLHAELNCLIKLDYNNPKDKIMYVTMSPCRMCAKCIINAKIKSVIYDDTYRDSSGIELLKSVGINVSNVQELQ